MVLMEGARTRQLVKRGRGVNAGRVVGDRGINSECGGVRIVVCRRRGSGGCVKGLALVGIAVMLSSDDVVSSYSAHEQRCAGTAPNSTNSLTESSLRSEVLLARPRRRATANFSATQRLCCLRPQPVRNRYVVRAAELARRRVFHRAMEVPENRQSRDMGKGKGSRAEQMPTNSGKSGRRGTTGGERRRDRDRTMQTSLAIVQLKRNRRNASFQGTENGASWDPKIEC
jgi:hypothetical protein